MEIIKEIPSGAIDGVNKSFTFLNSIDYINDLWMDGAVYTSFTITGNIVTLADAPLYSIFADYMPTGSIIPVTSVITYGDIKSKVWNLLGQKPTSINFSNDIVGDEINAISLEVWRGRVVNLLNPQQIIRAGDLWFQKSDFSFKVKFGGTAGEKVIVGANEISTPTTDLLGAGYALIGGDIINYTGINSEGIVGVTGLTTEHIAGSKIYQLYEVPVSLEDIIGLDKIFTHTNSVTYTEIPLNNGLVNFKLLRVGAKVLLNVNNLAKDSEIRVRYSKKYNDLTNDSDITPFPDKYGINVIAYLVAGALAYDKGLPTSERLLNRAYGNLRAMYQYFTNETKVTKQKLMPKHYSFNSIK